jgi:hypothetical protein
MAVLIVNAYSSCKKKKKKKTRIAMRSNGPQETSFIQLVGTSLVPTCCIVLNLLFSYLTGIKMLRVSVLSSGTWRPRWYSQESGHREIVTQRRILAVGHKLW